MRRRRVQLALKDYHQAHAFQPMNAASWLEALPPQERWRPLLASEGPRIATWVLALGLGVQAAFLVTDLAGTRAASRLSRRPPPVPRAPPLDVAAITGAHLFGSAAPVPGTSNPARPPCAKLVLTGTIAGNDPQNGLAIIGQNAQSVKVYAVGDTLPGNVRLHSVYTDRVIIDHDGQLEVIQLPHQASASNAPPPSAASFQSENPALERMRRMITEQPNLIGDVIRASPVMDHGHMNGFRIYPGRDRAAFTRLGLHPADQVTAVNGTPLDDRDRSEQILKTLSSSSEARVTVDPQRPATGAHAQSCAGGPGGRRRRRAVPGEQRRCRGGSGQRGRRRRGRRQPAAA